MPIAQYGSLNTTAIQVPQVAVQLVPPQTRNLNGVPTDMLGLVGVGSWGPVGAPVVTGSYADFVGDFGVAADRAHDLGTAVSVAASQGAQNLRVVRVTDGTDTAATGSGPAGTITLTARHTGSRGNAATLSLSPGSRANTWRAVVQLPGLLPEVFDNIAGTGNEFWVNLAAAINLGTGVTRAASRVVTAAAGAATAAPSSAVLVTMSGGTDGDAVATADLLGSDAYPRTGMHALRGQRVRVLDIAELTDVTAWPAVATFAADERCYAVVAGAPGESIADAGALKQAAGIDTDRLKVMLGDWLFIQDAATGLLRLVSPASVVAGRLANLAPHNSTLNKPVAGIVGSQRSGLPGAGTGKTYSDAELSALRRFGIDVVTNPSPGGAYWSCRLGVNASSDPAIDGDNYSRMADYVATTIEAGTGIYVGEPHTPVLRMQVRSTVDSFLAGLVQQGLLVEDDEGRPFSVVCDGSNNPASRKSLGYTQVDAQVRLTPINRVLLVNLELGQTVKVNSVTSRPL